MFHFLAAGAALFVLSGLNGDGPEENDGMRIVVTPERIDQLRDGWQKTRQRPPTAQELEGLIDHYIREEVLYREGVAMGLDRDDVVIRRRVAQKVEFLVQDLAAVKDPTDADLKGYFHDHAERFFRPPRITFDHVYFSTDRRGPQAEADAGQLLQRISTSEPPANVGDAFLLDNHYADITKGAVARDFGDGFADTIFKLPEGEWQGPVRSAYGVHLVNVRNRTDAVLPPFEEVRGEARNLYQDERRREQNAAIVREMRSRYDTVIQHRGSRSGARQGGP